MYGKAPVDADKIAEWRFFQEIAQGGQHRIFPAGRDDAGIIVQCLEVDDLMELQLYLFRPVFYEDGVGAQGMV